MLQPWHFTASQPQYNISVSQYKTSHLRMQDSDKVRQKWKNPHDHKNTSRLTTNICDSDSFNISSFNIHISKVYCECVSRRQHVFVIFFCVGMTSSVSVSRQRQVFVASANMTVWVHGRMASASVHDISPSAWTGFYIAPPVAAGFSLMQNTYKKISCLYPHGRSICLSWFTQGHAPWIRPRARPLFIWHDCCSWRMSSWWRTLVRRTTRKRIRFTQRNHIIIFCIRCSLYYAY